MIGLAALGGGPRLRFPWPRPLSGRLVRRRRRLEHPPQNLIPLLGLGANHFGELS